MPAALLRLRDVPAWISQMRELPFEERLERASAAFLGVPYQGDAVGEGRNGEFDRRPAFRFDRFDCHTYVETALALAAASSGRQFRSLLLALRYQEGKVGFVTRNHMTISQWVTHNAAAGLVRNVTADIADAGLVRRETQKADVGGWFKRLNPARLRGFREDPAASAERLARLQNAWTGPRWHTSEQCWLPLSSVVRAGEPFPGGAKVQGMQVNKPVLERFPHGAVVIVRSATWIHLALALRCRGTWKVRHASRSQGKVAEHPLVPLLINFVRFGEAQSLMVLEPLLT
jgi:Protein of unknown function (DUF1460)